MGLFCVDAIELADLENRTSALPSSSIHYYYIVRELCTHSHNHRHTSSEPAAAAQTTTTALRRHKEPKQRSGHGDGYGDGRVLHHITIRTTATTSSNVERACVDAFWVVRACLATPKSGAKTTPSATAPLNRRSAACIVIGTTTHPSSRRHHPTSSRQNERTQVRVLLFIVCASPCDVCTMCVRVFVSHSSLDRFELAHLLSIHTCCHMGVCVCVRVLTCVCLLHGFRLYVCVRVCFAHMCSTSVAITECTVNIIRQTSTTFGAQLATSQHFALEATRCSVGPQTRGGGGGLRCVI